MKLWSIALLTVLVASCNAQAQRNNERTLKAPPQSAIAIFASGCFWCTEHIFESIPGVDSVISGYAGGKTVNPSYELVNTETTGHAESVIVYYKPSAVSFAELTKVFFLSHDPTTFEQQGPDRGNSYRSIAFYGNNAELQTIKSTIDSLEKAKLYTNKIVTEVTPVTRFYDAEDYHQDYIVQHPNDRYVQSVSIPRFQKFRSLYKGAIKK